jgi:hypothetical protein
MDTVSHEAADGSTKYLLHQKSVHLLFFSVVGDCEADLGTIRVDDGFCSA